MYRAWSAIYRTICLSGSQEIPSTGRSLWHSSCIRLAFYSFMQHKQAPQGTRTQRPLRSAQMINCLRESFLYSEKRARDILFGAIEILLGTTRESPQILCRLTREAAIRANQNAQAVGYEFSNWDAAANAVIRAMLNAGVLLTYDGSPVPVGIAAQATTVVGLKEGYRDLTEGYLVGFLIRKLRRHYS